MSLFIYMSLLLSISLFMFMSLLLFISLFRLCRQSYFVCVWEIFTWPGHATQLQSLLAGWLAGLIALCVNGIPFFPFFPLLPFPPFPFPFLPSSLFQRLPTDQISACPCFVFHLKFRCESCINLESKRSPTLRHKSCWEKRCFDL